MEPFRTFTGLVAPLNRAHVDTDQVIPKQFLKSITRTGLGKGLFFDWRLMEDGTENPNFSLNQPRYRGASILLARQNFGCGSSREHAPWALMDFGFRALVAPSFADIFYNNCFKNGMLPVALDETAVDEIFKKVQAKEGLQLTVNLENQTLTDGAGGAWKFEIDPFRRKCLLEGLDDISLTLQQEEKISAFEARRYAPRNNSLAKLPGIHQTMRTTLTVLSAVICFSLSACQSEETMESPKGLLLAPPKAKTVPHKLEKHGHVRTDNYYWLRERENPEVISYLEAENEYTAAERKPTESLQENLFQEFKTRIKQTDISVPYKKDGYFYYSRTEEGHQYGIYCRKQGTLEAEEQVLVDVNQVAEGHEYCSLGSLAISTDGNLAAYGVDTVGRRIYAIQFKDLKTGKLLDDVISDTTGNLAWANDNKTVFYTKQDPETLRSYRIYRHRLGTAAEEDKLIFEEADETYNCYVFKTKSKKYILIGSRQTLATEYRYLEADTPQGDFKIFLPRERDHEYDIDHYGSHFYIRTNREAKNFRLMRTPLTKTQPENWEEVIPHRQDVFFEDMELFSDYLVATERKDGLLQMRIRPWLESGSASGSGEGEHYVDFGEPTYTTYPTSNHEMDTPVVRYGYSSMTTPQSVYDYNMVTREKKLLKQEEVLGGFDSADYRTERIYATASDGVRVPISIVYRQNFAGKDFKKDGARPLLVYGYGSYGHSIDAWFSPYRVSLLDRGFVYALAHIRGGQEMGRQWYEDGKLLKKKNTFTDFIACAEHLVQEKYADPKRVYASGGSAGGLLMGAVVNLRPELFHGVLAAVPFVDVVTTMLDDDIPLTTGEYDEWGNPNEKRYYDYIFSYSPYDQVTAQAYPNLLVTTGLHDSQVQYWEPAKWVAKMRTLKTGNNRLLLKTEMDAGHGGVSGRDKRYKETAFEFAFLLNLAGRQE